MAHKSAAIIGGGVIGLAIGWRLARRGLDVTVFDRDHAGRSASWMAAGMLAPLSEVGFEDDGFLALGRNSLEAYPAFLAELEVDGGVPVELDTRGTMFVGLHRDDNESLRRLFSFRRHLDLPVEWLSGSAAREREPLLSPKTTGAMWIPDDHQIDNRQLVDALRAALLATGGALCEDTEVTGVRCENGRAVGVETGEEFYESDCTVLAAGAWSGTLSGIDSKALPPVRPVKGQIVTLRARPEFSLQHMIRAPDAYLLPKNDGRVLVGATQEEMGFDTTPTAGPVMRLLERGWEAVPSIYDLPIDSIDVGLRPGTRDNEPAIGPGNIDGFIVATGHFRHGILLAPATALAVEQYVINGTIDPLIERFLPGRFNSGVKQWS